MCCVYVGYVFIGIEEQLVLIVCILLHNSFFLIFKFSFVLLLLSLGLTLGLELEVELEAHFHGVLESCGVGQISGRAQGAELQVESGREGLLELEREMTSLVDLEVDGVLVVNVVADGCDDVGLGGLQMVHTLCATLDLVHLLVDVDGELSVLCGVLASCGDDKVLDSAVMETGDVGASAGHLALGIHDDLEAVNHGDVEEERSVGGRVGGVSANLEETVDSVARAINLDGVLELVALGCDFVLGSAAILDLLGESASVAVSLLLDLEVDVAILKTLEIDLLLVVSYAKFVGAVVADLHDRVRDLESAGVPLGEETVFSAAQNFLHLGAALADLAVALKHRHDWI